MNWEIPWNTGEQEKADTEGTVLNFDLNSQLFRVEREEADVQAWVCSKPCRSKVSL